MALTEKQFNEIREELQTSKKPLIFFHDDADGLCSFLLFYKFLTDYAEDCKGIIIKTSPKVDKQFIRKAQEYNPDKIFIVDIAIVEQEFIDEMKCPIIWVDHHTPLDRDKIKYYNPRISKQEDNFPASYLCHKVTGDNLWIATVGAIGDWFWPDYADEFKKKYPDLLPEDVNDPETALFETKVGKLMDIMSFCLKGTTQEAMKYVKVFTRIKSPYEILNQETAPGKYVYKRYAEFNKSYEAIKNEALKNKPDGDLLLFTYQDNSMSFTKDLANEFLHRFPDKVIIIAREKDGDMKMSIRAKDKIIPPMLEKALEDGVEGYGGGHEHACGANVKKRDFDKFIENFKKQL